MSFLPTLEQFYWEAQQVLGKTTHFMTDESLIVHLYVRKLFFLSCSEPVMCAKHQDSRGN